MRISAVNQVRILSAQISSIVQFGDSVAVSPRSKVLAIQREVPVYQENEGDLNQFRIFRQNIPEPLPDESWSISIRNESPEIRVGSITIYGLSVSAVLQIGSSMAVDMENRTKHIRQLLKGERPV